jgi:hypothetical protein
MAERTTPAGRFASEPGVNIHGEAIIWVDYDAAIAIHRLRPSPPAERRPQRLASASALDKRISLGWSVLLLELLPGQVDQIDLGSCGSSKAASCWRQAW